MNAWLIAVLEESVEVANAMGKLRTSEAKNCGTAKKMLPHDGRKSSGTRYPKCS